MADLTPSQLRTRSRVESVIRLAAPLLDGILVVGDRVSRVLEPEDHEHYPTRPVGTSDRTPIGGERQDPTLRR
ncbi:MAG: hypothetical protein ACR2NA_03060 [Solirubrobacterales bacterium]